MTIPQAPPPSGLAVTPREQALIGGDAPRDKAAAQAAKDYAAEKHLPLDAVTVLGGKVYTNNKGLTIMLRRDERGPGSVAVEVVKDAWDDCDLNLVQRRMGSTSKEATAKWPFCGLMRAKVKSAVSFPDGSRYEAFGDASVVSISMTGLHHPDYINMMAETRAVNRAIRRATGMDTTAEELADASPVRTLSDGRVIDTQSGEVLALAAGSLTSRSDSDEGGLEERAIPIQASARAPSKSRAVERAPAPAPAPASRLPPPRATVPGGNAHAQQNAADWTREQLRAAIEGLEGQRLYKFERWQQLARDYDCGVPASTADMTQPWLLCLYQAMQAQRTRGKIGEANDFAALSTLMADAIGLRDRREISTEQYAALDEQAQARYARLAAPADTAGEEVPPEGEPTAEEYASDIARRIRSAPSEREIGAALELAQTAKDAGLISQEQRVDLLRGAETRRAALSGPLTAQAG